MTQIDDPHAQREAQKYDNPIPSREFIMDHLRDRSGPATLKQVSFELALFELRTWKHCAVDCVLWNVMVS